MNYVLLYQTEARLLEQVYVLTVVELSKHSLAYHMQNHQLEIFDSRYEIVFFSLRGNFTQRHENLMQSSSEIL